MRKIKLIALMLTSALLFTACDKDDEDDLLDLVPTEEVASTDVVKATINGADWSVNNLLVNTMVGYISISGNSTTHNVTIGIPEGTAKGTYNIPEVGGVSIVYASGEDVMVPESGSCTITEHDTAGKKIKGTYSVKGKLYSAGTLINITNGEFSAEY